MTTFEEFQQFLTVKILRGEFPDASDVNIASRLFLRRRGKNQREFDKFIQALCLIAAGGHKIGAHYDEGNCSLWIWTAFYESDDELILGLFLQLRTVGVECDVRTLLGYAQSWMGGSEEALGGNHPTTRTAVSMLIDKYLPTRHHCNVPDTNPEHLLDCARLVEQSLKEDSSDEEYVEEYWSERVNAMIDDDFEPDQDVLLKIREERKRLIRTMLPCLQWTCGAVYEWGPELPNLVVLNILRFALPCAENLLTHFTLQRFVTCYKRKCIDSTDLTFQNLVNEFG